MCRFGPCMHCSWLPDTSTTHIITIQLCPFKLGINATWRAEPGGGGHTWPRPPPCSLAPRPAAFQPSPAQLRIPALRAVRVTDRLCPVQSLLPAAHKGAPRQLRPRPAGSQRHLLAGRNCAADTLEPGLGALRAGEGEGHLGRPCPPSRPGPAALNSSPLSWE